MQIELREIAGREILAGAEFGREILGIMLNQIDNDQKESPELVYVDFRCVEVATASFLREAVVEFRDVVRRRLRNHYPVIANANRSILDELNVLVEPSRNVIVSCTLDLEDRPIGYDLVGRLEDKQQVAFDLVIQLGEASASELRDAARSEGVSLNAWNNRLAALSKLGLVLEFSQGKSKSYQPLPIGV